MSSPCDRCNAPCCHEPHVLLSGREALRIADTLSLPLEDFVVLPSREQAEGEYRIVLRDETGQLSYHRMELRKRPSLDESFLVRCNFLITSADGARCGCYSVRPRACIAFPYLERGDDVVINRLARVYCPPGAWRDLPIDVPAHRLLRRTQESDRAIYSDIIATWNARVSDEESPFDTAMFLAHLRAAYTLRGVSIQE